MSTAFLHHPDCLLHDVSPFHPENPERLRAVLDWIESSDLSDRLLWTTPDPAEVRWVEKIHNPNYVQAVQEACEKGGGHFDADTAVVPASYRAALLAVGAALRAVDLVASGEAQNAFCAVRPPGHHAERSRAMGFCLFNTIAIAARYAQEQHRLKRILIVDWDVHHGNGTQHAFERDPTVFFFSTHQHPHYPGTGLVNEMGIGPGEGYTLNVPLPPGCGDEEYEAAFREKLRPSATWFSPDLVLISAGFDAHRDDPLSSMQVTERGFETMTRTVRRIADDLCGGRLVSLLEGGYDLDALAHCVETHVRVLMEE
ncbi:MAG: histone deacetylase [Candidatus Latescibacteria bacterium]|nr:histone deacetylase [Candidatus Latescibacterota bacterium]